MHDFTAEAFNTVATFVDWQKESEDD